MFSFKTNHPDNYLNFTVAKFAHNGTLIKYGKLDETLELCSFLQKSLTLMMKFGKTFKSKCDLKVDSIWEQFETSFYEIFLHYYDEEVKSHRSIPVPILITNFKSLDTFISHFENCVT